MSSRVIQVSVVVLVTSLAIVGCARKAAETPPAEPAAAPAAPVTSEPSAAAPAEPVNPSPPAPEFQPVFFDFNSYGLSAGARGALDTDAGVLRSQPQLNVTIEGHCDERGTTEYNQALGERRANAARDYLVAAGVEAGRIQTISFGEERPIASGAGEDSWSQNRRAQVVLR